ncbi:MAG: hypothetical protein JNJ98_02300, partial [Gemmatimonadetes bacterium]|nr:hypothetical protein [Gemmatimonadota bacterium]
RAATVYSILVGLALLSFVPGALWTRSWTYVITLLPIVLLGRSAVVMASGAWREKARLEDAAIRGFLGMLSIPLALGAAFAVQALRR